TESSKGTGGSIDGTNSGRCDNCICNGTVGIVNVGNQGVRTCKARIEQASNCTGSNHRAG
ncbi:MAG: hypothetical protein EBU90_22290, partial [Proteobacteria bacterium]|nr:hypothetical protein [Pseudomonadota bacterium]